MSRRLAKRVLLIAWDGADWQMIHPLVDAGELPHLARIVESGVMGELATLQPQLSPLLWASVATGKRADKHRVLGYLEPGDGLRATTSDSRRARAVWNILGEAGLRSHVVGWPSYPAEAVDGVFVAQHFTRHGSDADAPRYRDLPRAVYPPELAARLAEFRLHPAELRLDDLAALVPRAAEVDQDRDPGLAIVATWLAETTGLHAAATWALEHEPWDFAAVHYDLIDRFGHAFMQFHPPRRRAVPEHAYRLYCGVMSAVYRYADMMLGRLVELAGPETTVIVMSDHGFRSAGDRPATSDRGRSGVAWHRPLGILAMRGEAFKVDEWVWGASLLDICPTILTLFGLAVGEDMDGRPLVDAFRDTVQVATKATWETLAADLPKGADTPSSAGDHEQEALRACLVDDGYLEREQIAGANATALAVDARDFNLAQDYLDQGRVGSAAELLQALVDRRPGVPRFALQLAQCRFTLGDTEACRRLVDEALAHDVPEWHGRRIRAQLLVAEGNHAAALEELFTAERIRPRQAGLHCQIGEVYVAMEKWDQAERAFRKELQFDADSAAAHAGLGNLALMRGDCEQAVEELLAAISLRQSQPQAHYLLGVALAKLDHERDAIRALARCLELDGDNQRAHCALAELYERTGDLEQATQHRRLAGA